MSPTLPVGATIMVNTHAYHSALPQRGDIVAYEDDERIWHTKRAIALPGDSLLMTEKQVIVNGAPRQEPYAIYIGFGSADAPREFGPTTVPAQGIFVLGDNRDYSLDSRCQQLGPIPLSQLRGKVVDVVTLRRTRRG